MPDPSLVAQINAGGSIYTTWKSMQVRRDYGNYVSVFQFTAAEPGPFGGSWDSLRLKPGDPCQILLGGVQVINGYVTTRVASYDANSHDLIIAGKSLTCDLHDSSVVPQPGTYDGSTFEQAARGVMAPHPVQLLMNNPPSIASKIFANLSVQIGETVGEFIDRTARMRSLILCDDKDGNLVAGQGNVGGAVVAQLQEGRNIKRATGKLDDQSVWSKYQAIGQQPSTDQNWPARAYSATADNSGVTRANRIRVTLAEHPGDSEDMQARANLEAARSTWPCVECSITVVGWMKPDGTLWDVTDNISVYSPFLFPNDSGSITLGVQAVTYAQDRENGTTTTMDLVLPQLLTTTPNPGNLGTPNGGDPAPSQAQPDPPDTGGGTPNAQ